jgi:hypothetical protein
MFAQASSLKTTILNRVIISQFSQEAVTEVIPLCFIRWFQ